MLARLPVLLVLLLLSGILLAAAGAHAESPGPLHAAASFVEPFEDEAEAEGEEESEGEEDECEAAEEEVEEGELTRQEAREICAGGAEEARPAARPGKGKRGAHKNACRARAAGHKRRHCAHRSHKR